MADRLQLPKMIAVSIFTVMTDSLYVLSLFVMLQSHTVKTTHGCYAVMSAHKAKTTHSGYVLMSAHKAKITYY